MSERDDPDLPGDADFVPVSDRVLPNGSQVMAAPVDYQQIVHHNKLRYAELQKLRRGQPNLYLESRYRK